MWCCYHDNETNQSQSSTRRETLRLIVQRDFFFFFDINCNYVEQIFLCFDKTRFFLKNCFTVGWVDSKAVCERREFFLCRFATCRQRSTFSALFLHLLIVQYVQLCKREMARNGQIFESRVPARCPETTPAIFFVCVSNCWCLLLLEMLFARLAVPIFAQAQSVCVFFKIRANGRKSYLCGAVLGCGSCKQQTASNKGISSLFFKKTHKRQKK